MKIYFVYSNSYRQVLKDNNCRILINFAVIGNKGKSIIPTDFSEVIIDSGGFQLQFGIKTTRPASIRSYALWLRLRLEQSTNVVGYFNLDIPNNWEATLENQKYLESQGLHPIPIWHVGDSEHILGEYCKNYEWIGIGNLQSIGFSISGIKTLAERVLQKYPKTKFHFLGVGISSLRTFTSLRPYSIDCSTWNTVVRFGHEIYLDKSSNYYTVIERKLPDNDRERIRTDKIYANQILSISVSRIKEIENMIELRNDKIQGVLI